MNQILTMNDKSPNYLLWGIFKNLDYRTLQVVRVVCKNFFAQVSLFYEGKAVRILNEIKYVKLNQLAASERSRVQQKIADVEERINPVAKIISDPCLQAIAFVEMAVRQADDLTQSLTTLQEVAPEFQEDAYIQFIGAIAEKNLKKAQIALTTLGEKIDQSRARLELIRAVAQTHPFKAKKMLKKVHAYKSLKLYAEIKRECTLQEIRKIAAQTPEKAFAKAAKLPETQYPKAVVVIVEVIAESHFDLAISYAVRLVGKWRDRALAAVVKERTVENRESARAIAGSIQDSNYRDQASLEICYNDPDAAYLDAFSIQNPHSQILALIKVAEVYLRFAKASKRKIT